MVVDGALSEEGQVVSGVPQGSVLGPLLFLAFINDLPNCVKSRVRLFADDCIVYREIHENKDTTTLQQDLDELEKWERKWEMDFHPDKCNILHVTRKKDVINDRYKLKGHILETVQSAKYLGVDIHHQLNWNGHIDRIVLKANRMLGFVKRNLQVSNQDTKVNAYKTLVRSNLEYCASIWSPYTDKAIEKVEAVQRRAARFCTNRYRNRSSVASMLDQLEWETLESQRSKIQLNTFYKIVRNLIDVNASDYLIPQTRNTRSSHDYNYQLPFCRTDTLKFSFFPRTIRVWNDIPAKIAESPSLPTFKKGLITLNLT